MLKKSSIKFLKNRYRHLLRFRLSSTTKNKMNIQKALPDTNARFKNFWIQKGISFVDNSGKDEFHLGNRNLHLSKKRNSTCTKNWLHHINRTYWSFFPYDLVIVNVCLSDTLEKAISSANSSLQTMRKDSLKLMFAYLNISLIRSVISVTLYLI